MRLCRPLRRIPISSRDPEPLLKVDGGTSLGELLLHLLGVSLGDLLLHGLGRGLDQILRLLEAQAGDLADRLDDLDLVGTRARENYVELGLLGSSFLLLRGTTAAARD